MQSTDPYPPRHWSLVGYPNSGKSTFAAQMRGPMLVVDADHRFVEVAHLAAADVFQLSNEPADAVDAALVAQRLRENMPRSGVKTVVFDSLTSILSVLITQGVLGKNRASHKAKALAMRQLQEAVSAWNVDTLWIYHLRSSLNGAGQQTESTTVSALELIRLRQSLNMRLVMVEDGTRVPSGRGVRVDWARQGRSGLTLWDASGDWHQMPERIEAAVYDGLTIADMATLETAPTTFSSPAAAIAWGYEQGVFRHARHAISAYAKCKRIGQPTCAADMWQLWRADVEQRRAAVNLVP